MHTLLNHANGHMAILATTGIALMGLSVPGRVLYRLVSPASFVAGLVLVVWSIFRNGLVAEAVLAVLVLLAVIVERPGLRDYLPRVAAPKKRLRRRFIFTSAIWGTSLTTIDSRELLNALIRDGVADFIADNTTLGGDPAPGEVKYLRVRWKKGWKNGASSFAEGTHVVLPD